MGGAAVRAAAGAAALAAGAALAVRAGAAVRATVGFILLGSHNPVFLLRLVPLGQGFFVSLTAAGTEGVGTEGVAIGAATIGPVSVAIGAAVSVAEGASALAASTNARTGEAGALAGAVSVATNDAGAATVFIFIGTHSPFLFARVPFGQGFFRVVFFFFTSVSITIYLIYFIT